MNQDTRSLAMPVSGKKDVQQALRRPDTHSPEVRTLVERWHQRTEDTARLHQQVEQLQDALARAKDQVQRAMGGLVGIEECISALIEENKAKDGPDKENNDDSQDSPAQ